MHKDRKGCQRGDRKSSSIRCGKKDARYASIHISLKYLGDSEVRIRVHATSLNFFDLLLLVGKYQHKPKLPFVVVIFFSTSILTIRHQKHLAKSLKSVKRLNISS